VPDDRTENRRRQFDHLIIIAAKHSAQLEVLSRITEKQSTRSDEQDARLNSLIAVSERQTTRADEQDARLNALMALAEIHEAHFAAVGVKIEKNSEHIAALTAAIADLDRRWQAYINTLPRQ
jgi:predicted alpha/beta superfamily hydrolase